MKTDSAILWETFWANRSPENRNALVEHHLPLALKLAKKWHKPGRHDFGDYVAWATIGLINAVEGYDPIKRRKFSTYAWRCIESKIIKGLPGEKLPLAACVFGRDTTGIGRNPCL